MMISIVLPASSGTTGWNETVRSEAAPPAVLPSATEYVVGVFYASRVMAVLVSFIDSSTTTEPSRVWILIGCVALELVGSFVRT
jgi:hypothetical protein